MTESLIRKWDLRYATATPEASRPCPVLALHAHLLPTSGGMALDLACGLGGNAIFLAERGFATTAWDISPVAVGKLREYAAARGLSVEATVRDVLSNPPEAESFDLIVVSSFLERALAPSLMRALRPGGLLFYQTWTREAISANGPGNPAFRLAPNELLHLFQDLRLMVYREEGVVGDGSRGIRDEAWLVAMR